MRSAAFLLLAAILVAGCSSSPSGPSASPSSTGTASSSSQSSTGALLPATAVSYTIELRGFPNGTLAPGSTFNFTDVIHGDGHRYSDHIGAHFGSNSTATPSTTAYNVTCVHQVGYLPGPGEEATFAVSCKAPMAPGTYHLRGHARITQDGTPVNWWSDEKAFTVA